MFLPHLSTRNQLIIDYIEYDFQDKSMFYGNVE